jgi:bleomycin hydrolase
VKILFLLLLFLSLRSHGQVSYIDFGLRQPTTTNCTAVKNQFNSSTCWAFSSNSFLESELLKNGMGEVDLSEMFVARYSLIRKIERHLALKGNTFFTPGGQFHDEMWVLAHFGMVPEEAYNGRPRGEELHNHAELDDLLMSFVRACDSNHVTPLSTGQKLMLDSALDYYLGKVPEQFTYKGKTYSPKSFATDYLKLHPEDYLEITSYTHHPFYARYALEDRYNWTGDLYWNVPLDDFMSITDNALAKGYTIGWDGDADDAGFMFQQGVAYIPLPIANFIMARQQAWNDSSTLLNHMMHVVAKVSDREGRKWYYVKNSWGSDFSPLGGYLFMREDYFKLRTVAIIVNKKAIPPDISKKLNSSGQ